MILSVNQMDAIAQAATHLAQGCLVGMPTETVYGLAADANNPQAVKAIFQTKGRPADHPLIVHVADMDDVRLFAQNVPDFATELMKQFWPGPLTVILPRRPGVAEAASGGHSSIGLRCPNHPVALALLEACKAQGVMGLAAPSANGFGKVSPTTAEHVQQALGEGLWVLDGGACSVGIESTIVDCTRGEPVVLRPGQISREQIAQWAGVNRENRVLAQESAPRASGTLESHYATDSKLRLMDTEQMRFEAQQWRGGRLALYVRTRALLEQFPRGNHCVVRAMPDQAEAAARNLFADLRWLDQQACTQIWVERPPQTPEWEGVVDRLERAAA